jgi:hypothetical protein
MSGIEIETCSLRLTRIRVAVDSAAYALFISSWTM